MTQFAGAIAHVETAGAGYPILCLHGHPGRGRSMGVFVEHLAPRYRTIAPDLRGYGRSQVSAPFVMHDHLDDLTALLDRLDIERCLLVGWSLGGILALESILAQPQRFSGTILVASAARPRGTHPPISKLDLLYTGIAGVLNWLKPGWEWNIQQFGQRSLFRYLVQQHTPATYRYLAEEGVAAYLQTSRHAQQALDRAIRAGYDRSANLNRIEVPCLVLMGAEDRHIAAAASRATADLLPDCQWCCYPDTAHLFPWEVPVRVLDDVDAWLHARPDVVGGCSERSRAGANGPS
ncbi:putative hydrolase or acyltransferase (alpha/beta hydrolase superfamily) [Rubidibacter lacunae KORDI 51-2]|uniref:Putative hydrolase or acyltransferase (Alpha/beta hydrolase superfamily) n=1 Tax=Rubidibacter lacunae KORDI 51-2 TaxID=582515 RepID=U5DIA8_9CHRO|nr:alpha/beta hydrolase [Rubidibacter lacunae]ERN41406.1 putative hydrolase or acyltransferase (alpha/beta hydrolase superfamily) [Rubidibacter lacunae KORDI 51-2]